MIQTKMNKNNYKRNFKKKLIIRNINFKEQWKMMKMMINNRTIHDYFYKLVIININNKS